MSRQAGWYWVKEHSYENWAAWHWNGVDFAGVDEDCFAVIGPRIPSPDEPWQCVPVEATADMLDVLTLGHLVTAPRRWREALAAAPKPGGGDEP
ncbi:hypothetical protein KUW00_19615 [Halomonas sp. DP5N14-9]|uniref:hypothetical protein n=1 Tax=unclassified Halomonas TaxID=2609666 RepID=UPI000D363C32|nr:MULTISPECIES: hypothetical protein [unclassified Halomonas]MBY5943087.1 hypothetical protein [Halomonas sp. DP5N14-9]